MYLTPQTSKQARTLRSRIIHYLQFIYAMNLTDDWFLESVTDERAQYQLAIYVAHLATGSTLYCKQVAVKTMKEYLRAASLFLSRVRKTDARFQNAVQKDLAPPIAGIFKECERWEKQPNRREPFTTAMWEHLAERCTGPYSPDTIELCLLDWFGCGLHGGWRLSEWAQEQKHSSFEKPPALNKWDDPLAFSIDDLTFKRSGNRRITLREVLDIDEDAIEEASITHRQQKNGDDGESRKFVRNRNSRIDSVTLLIRIFKRFIRLVGWRNDVPMSVYKAPEGNIKYITSTEICRVMRITASAVYNLDPITNASDLQRWSAHSLRVGACVILHAMGFDATQIQFLLRWRSMAFMAYLRNLGFLALKQSQAIEDARVLPTFL
jgi:hypothetical protein